MTDPKPNYDVGYKKPPKATQFQQGQSGNPKGRPKGSLSLAAALEAALRERVVISENGRSTTLSKLEILMKQAVNKAAGGDLRAIQFVTQALSLFPPPEAKGAALDQGQDEDQQILLRLADRIRRTTRNELAQVLTQEKPSGPTTSESDPGGTQGPVSE